MSPLDRLTAWLHWRDATALTAPAPTPLPEPAARMLHRVLTGATRGKGLNRWASA